MSFPSVFDKLICEAPDISHLPFPLFFHSTHPSLNLAGTHTLIHTHATMLAAARIAAKRASLGHSVQSFRHSQRAFLATATTGTAQENVSARQKGTLCCCRPWEDCKACKALTTVQLKIFCVECSRFLEARQVSAWIHSRRGLIYFCAFRPSSSTHHCDEVRITLLLTLTSH
jgi:hypothetical protein